MVTGTGSATEKVLFSNNQNCRNQSSHFESYLRKYHTRPGSFQVYHCGDKNEMIPVLYIPHCIDEYHGADGPCCLNEAAILFYSALYKANSETSKSNQFPNWFVFSDDDYYLRLTFINSILNSGKTPSSKPFVFVSSNNVEDTLKTQISKDKLIETVRPGIGLWMQSLTCTVPCIHRTGVSCYFSSLNYTVSWLHHYNIEKI